MSDLFDVSAIKSSVAQGMSPYVNGDKRQMKKEQFFPRPNYQDENSIRNNWYLKGSYRDKLWFRYLKDDLFRGAVNSYILDHKRDKDTLVNVVMDAVVNNESFILEMTGFIRSGKSRFARRIVNMYANICQRNYYIHCDATDLKNEFFVDMGYDNKFSEPFHVYVTYSTSETNFIIKNVFNPGDIIFQDEIPKQHGAGSGIEKDNINNIIKIASGKKRINIIFISPVIVEYPNVDYYLTIMGVCKPRERTCCLISSSEKEHVGIMEIDVKENKDITEYYEIVSDKRKEEIQRSGGASGVAIIKEEKEKLVKILLEKVREKHKALNIPMKHKQDIEAVAAESADVMAYTHKQYVIQEVYQMVKYANALLVNPSVDDDDVDLSNVEYDEDGLTQFKVNDYSPDMRKILKHYDNKRDSDIYIDNKLNGKSQDEIVKDLGERNEMMSQSNVCLIVNKVNVWLNQQIGRDYEEFLTKRLWLRHPDAISIKHYGGPGEPDIVVELPDSEWVVYSVKCFSTTRTQVSISKSDILPEIYKCRKLLDENEENTAKCVLHFFNRDNGILVEKDVDFLAPDETYLIEAN